MFTGIIEEVGTVVSGGPRLGIAARTVAAGTATGSSVSVGGVCLTVIRVDGTGDGDGAPATLWFDLSEETIARTSLGPLTPGRGVNLERPVTLGTRLGGHLVQGHVDGVATVTGVRDVAPGRVATFALHPRLARYVVEKGSVAVDGVSLTAVDVGPDRFSVALVPATLAATTLGATRPGDRVNVEVDIVGKYVERFVGRPS